MNILSRLFGGKKDDGAAHLMVPNSAGHDSVVLRSSPLRKGMWVHCGDRGVGILVRAYDNATAEVHLVNGKGETVICEDVVPLAELRQACLEDIPEPRRPAYGPVMRAKTGYFTRDERRALDEGRVIA